MSSRVSVPNEKPYFTKSLALNYNLGSVGVTSQ